MPKSRHEAAGLVLLLACSSYCVAQEAPANPVKVSIAAQPLGRALNAWASQTGYQVLIPESAAQGRTAPGVNGMYTPEGALKILLASSDLHYEFVRRRLVTIREPNSDSSAADAKSPAAGSKNDEKSKEAGHPLVLAQSRPRETEEAAARESNASLNRQSRDREPTAEVIVTAQKRSEKLLDVPVPVSVVSADALVGTHQLRLEDYYTRVPSLSLTLLPPDATPTVSIRGVTTGGSSNPTVGIVVDEVAYGSTVASGNYLSVADIDPNDLARVEVLRGPQGTLYGANSLGGLLKFATVDPSTDKFSGHLQAGTSSVRNGDGLGYDVRGVVNIPLSSTFAMRASAFSAHDAGYIDNVRTGQDGVNRKDSEGGRLAALWRPTESTSLKVTALYQDIDRKGSADVAVLPGLGDLEQNYVVGTGGYHRQSQAYGATLSTDFGKVSLTSATGYSIDKTQNVQDDTSTFFSGQANLFFGVTGAANFFDRTVDKFTQELRLSMPLGSRFDWLVGAFYTHEKADISADFWALDPLTGAKVGRMIDVRTPDNKFEEYAAFSDLTVHFTDRFDVQFGGRISENKQSFYSVRTGPRSKTIFGSDPSITSSIGGKDNPFTYLVTPRFKLNPDVMLYARLASGYRPGAPNPNCGLTPCKSIADTTRNYEIGVKGEVLDHRLTFDSSVYYIDWKDIQLLLFQAGNSYTGNAGRARSKGFELAVQAYPIEGLTIGGSLSLNQAELADPFPPTASVYGASGDRLPYGSKVSGNISVDDRFPLWGTTTGYVGVSTSYVGERKGVFRGLSAGVPLPRQVYPSYTQVDLRAGATFDEWNVGAFVNNLTDRRALIGGDVANFVAFAYNYTQPRTVGLTVTRSF